MGYKVNDQVMHFREGLSIIVKQTIMNNVDYFILQLCRQGGETIYVPVNSADAVIRHVVNKEQADEVINFMKEVKPEYITNTKQRRDAFKKRVGSGVITDLAILTIQLYFFNHPEKLEVPLKLGPADVELLKFAHCTIMDELAIAYNLNRNNIEEFIFNKIYN